MKTFLLNLVFFILIGTSYSQTWLDNSCPIEEKVTNEKYTSSKSNNLLTIILDQEGKLLVNDKKSDGLSEIKFKETVYDFMVNPSKDETKADSPEQAIIAIGSYGVNETYDLILTYLREVYLYAWDTAAKEKYGEIYMDLDCKKRKKIRNKEFAYNIFELNTKEKSKPKMNIGIPPFRGDVIDN